MLEAAGCDDISTAATMASFRLSTKRCSPLPAWLVLAHCDPSVSAVLGSVSRSAVASLLQQSCGSPESES